LLISVIFWPLSHYCLELNQLYTHNKIVLLLLLSFCLISSWIKFLLLCYETAGLFKVCMSIGLPISLSCLSSSFQQKTSLKTFFFLPFLCTNINCNKRMHIQLIAAFTNHFLNDDWGMVQFEPILTSFWPGPNSISPCSHRVRLHWLTQFLH